MAINTNVRRELILLPTDRRTRRLHVTRSDQTLVGRTLAGASRRRGNGFWSPAPNTASMRPHCSSRCWCMRRRGSSSGPIQQVTGTETERSGDRVGNLPVILARVKNKG